MVSISCQAAGIFRYVFFTVLSAVIVLLSGCTLFDSDPDKNQTNISSAGSLFYDPGSGLSPVVKKQKSTSFTELDYCQLLKMHGFTSEISSHGNCVVNQAMIGSGNNKFSSMRNELQDYILAASNQKCGEYKRTLHGLRANGEVFWGGLSTLLAGAGAVISHGPTAQAFSAGGAASSGIRAETTQAYFANLTVEVITAGIQSRQIEVLREINKNRELGNDYSLNGAVRDAMAYHAACSAIVGLEVASQSVTRADNPGAKEFRRFWEDIKGINRSGAGEAPSGKTSDQPGQAATGTANAAAAGSDGVVPATQLQKITESVDSVK